MSGQSIVDRLNAAKHTVAGSALGRAVVKATTEEIIAPKRKHLDYLLQCTSELNVSIPQMADLLIERTQNTSWVVTFKALITIHHLMCYGNERFSQYMASHNSKFALNNFMDRSGTQGIDMSTYIRKYANYLSEKRETYKLMGFDFCKVKRGKEDGMLRTMNTEKLLKTLPILQKQLDSLVGFDVQPNELTNGVINSCFVLMSKDLIRLFACYNDGVINLLEKFFDMNKKNCKEALDLYKKFLDRTDKVSAFLKVAESSGMDKSDIPDLTKAPGSLLEALEAHVNNIENKKGGPVSTSSNGGAAAAAAASQGRTTAVTSAINSLNNNTSLTEEEKQRVLDEEAKTLEQFKSNHLKKQASVTSPTSETNPFGASNGTHKSQTNQNDLFGLDLSGIGSAPSPANGMGSNGHSSAANDLLGLNANPFGVAPMSGGMAAPSPFAMNPLPMVNNPFQAPVMMMPPQQPMNLFSPVNNANYSANNKMMVMTNNPYYYYQTPATSYGLFNASSSNEKNDNKNSISGLLDSKDDLFDLNFDSTPVMSQSLSNSNIAASNYSDSTTNASSSGFAETTASFLGSSASNTTFSKSSENVSTTGHSDTNPAFNKNQSINIGFTDFDAYGDVLQPTNLMNPTSAAGHGSNNSKQASTTNLADQKILSNDLDSSLAILADNLAINKNNHFGKNHQWNGNGTQGANQAKPTGGQNWKPTGGAQPMAASWNPSLSNTTTPLGGAPAQNWMNPNPFMAAPMAANNQMNMQPQAQQQTTVGSNNPFDLF